MEYNITKGSTLTNDVFQNERYEDHLKGFNRINEILEGKSLEAFQMQLEFEIVNDIKDEKFYDYSDEADKKEIIERALNSIKDYVEVKDIISNNPHYSTKPTLIVEDLTKTDLYPALKALYEAMSLFNSKIGYQGQPHRVNQYIENIARLIRTSNLVSGDKLPEMTIDIYKDKILKNY